MSGLLSQLPQPLLHEIWQVADEQAGVPFVALHILLHVPQLVGEPRSVSQPLARLLSQLPKPGLQVMPHWPAAQLAVPLFVLHAMPQPLQCVGLAFRFVSQPFVARLSQLPKPELQVMPHVPLLQDRIPLLELHTVVQLPQRLTSAPRFVSQPGAALSQSPNPRLQVMPHTPPVHEAAPF